MGQRLNKVRFRIPYKVLHGQAVYISFQNCIQYPNPQRMQVIVTDNDHYWEIILPFSQRGADETLSYSYYVGDYNNPNYIIRPIIWQQSQSIMKKHFQRNSYLGTFAQIVDRCDKQDKQSEPKTAKRNGTIFIDLGIRYNLNTNVQYGGQWVYVMDISDYSQNPQNDHFLKVQRMELIKSKQIGKKDLWRIQYPLSFENLQRAGGTASFIFIKSYYYHRISQLWQTFYDSRKTRNLTNVRQTLHNMGIPYLSIPSIDLTTHKITNNTIYWSDDDNAISYQFKYQLNNDINITNVWQVFVISNIFGKRLMHKSTTNQRLWLANILLPGQAIKNMVYSFQVTFLDQKIYSSRQPQLHYTTNWQKSNFIYVPNTTISVYSNCRGNYSPCSPSYTSGSYNHYAHTNSYTSYYPTQGPRDIYVNSNVSYTPYSNYTQTKTIVSNRQMPSYSTLSASTAVVTNHLALLSDNSSIKQVVTPFVQQFNTFCNQIHKTKYKNNIFWNHFQQQKRINGKIRDYIYIPTINYNQIQTDKLQQIADKFQPIKQRIRRDFPQISQKTINLRQLRNQVKQITKSNFQGMIKNNRTILSIIILTSVKKWGKNQFNTGQQIVKIIDKHIELKKYTKGHILQCCSELNKYTKQRKFYQNFRSSYDIKFAEELMRATIDSLYDQIRQKYFTESSENIRKSQFFILLKNLIDMDFSEYNRGQYKIQYDISSSSLIRCLMNYCFVYSFGQKYGEEHEFPPFCHAFDQLKPFCEEKGKYANTFKLQTLQKIRNILMEANQIHDNKIVEINQRIQKQQKQVINLLQEKCQDKQILGMISIDFQMNRLRQKMNRGFDMKLTILINQEEQFKKDLDIIDELTNEEQRFSSIRDIKGHKFLKVIEEFF